MEERVGLPDGDGTPFSSKVRNPRQHVTAVIQDGGGWPCVHRFTNNRGVKSQRRDHLSNWEKSVYGIGLKGNGTRGPAWTR